MEELELGQPPCYKFAYKEHYSNNLIISFTPTKGYFLYHNDLDAHKICVASTHPNYYIFNPGNACKKIVDYIKDLNISNIILIGSSKAGLASLVWGGLIRKMLPKQYNIFALSFSPQTLLYPFNDRLYFPSYTILMNSIQNNVAMLKCAENYGDVNKVLADSELEGMIIYPKLNPCDQAEAERVAAKNIRLIGLDYPLHGSFLPFMSQAKNKEKLRSMVKKIYSNAKGEQDITATIPESEEKLFKIISSIEVPTIEELCKAMFFKMNNGRAIDNFEKVKRLGFI